MQMWLCAQTQISWAHSLQKIASTIRVSQVHAHKTQIFFSFPLRVYCHFQQNKIYEDDVSSRTWFASCDRHFAVEVISPKLYDEIMQWRRCDPYMVRPEKESMLTFRLATERNVAIRAKVTIAMAIARPNRILFSPWQFFASSFALPTIRAQTIRVTTLQLTRRAISYSILRFLLRLSAWCKQSQLERFEFGPKLWHLLDASCVRAFEWLPNGDSWSDLESPAIFFSFLAYIFASSLPSFVRRR